MDIAREDWTLVVLAAAWPRTLTPVQLQKVLFLFGEELPAVVGPEFYPFKPYNYGPFSSAIYSDAEHLETAGLARLTHNGRWNEYGATEDGLRKAARLSECVDKRVLSYVKSLVAWAMSLSFDELVRAVYTKFPDMRKNSVWIDAKDRDQ